MQGTMGVLISIELWHFPVNFFWFRRDRIMVTFLAHPVFSDHIYYNNNSKSKPAF